MMKKLLVLMLVLATGGFATAGFIVQVESPTEFSISLDEAVKGYEFNVEVLGLPGDTLALGPAVSYGFTWEFDNITMISTETQWRGGGSQLFGVAQGPGKFLTLSYTGQGYVKIADAYNPQFEALTAYIPEPVSIMLLGLGGLFLRRRK
jgi:hypothetical protein